MIIQTTKRKYSVLFRQQILLSTSKEQASSIIKEAKKYDVNHKEEVWSTRFNSMWSIKNDQTVWREKLRLSNENKNFSYFHENFCALKVEHFDSLPLKQLAIPLLEQKSENKNSSKSTRTSIHIRKIYIKGFAKRASSGICQLCENEGPILDKQGQPFLEVHHIHYFSNGGKDTIDNVIAICPNCHRIIHHLELEEDIKKIS